MPDGSSPGTSQGILIAGNQYDVTGLTTGQDYQFFVKTICGSNLESNWRISPTFTPFVTLAPLTANTSQYTVPQLVNEVLISNPCMTATNITSSTGLNFGSVNGIGYFVNANPTFPLESGLILSTGSALNVHGPNNSVLGDGATNWPGDPQLDNVILAATGSSLNSQNATKLEFDFTTLIDDISFNFLFASEEYGTFQCSFSDAFAFLLTDLVSGVTTNIAVVPTTNVPVSVVTVRDNANNGACSSENPEYFDTLFSGSLAASSATNFNGQTTEMTASATVIPNHPYHIKLVVADRGDSAYDSAVFIEAGSFSAGPPQCLDKIKMVAFIDGNGNGIKDNGEVNFTYGSFTYQQNNAGDIHNIISPSGEYVIYDSNPANVYDLAFTISPEYSTYFSTSALVPNDINIPTGSGTQTFYFPITMTQGFNDVQVTLIPENSPRPAGTWINKIVYTNLGIAQASGSIEFINEPLTNILNVSQPGVTNTASGFSYNFTNLQPYETRTIVVQIAVPAPPTFESGDLLTNSVTISAPSGDINLNNNASAVAQTAVNSVDPNNVVESHGEKIQFNQFSANDYLYYTINFQNIGTADAIDVRIEDLLDARLDETSIRMVSASHDYVMERIGNQLAWRFDYIQLPGATVNEALSKGYVTFRIKLKPGFAVGTIIPNMASIYFDANAPIATNTFYTEFVQQLAAPQFTSSNVVVYPNPASGSVNISLTNMSGNIESIALYDMVGKLVKSVSSVADSQTTVDISALSRGIYLMEVVTGDQLRLTQKLIIK